MSQIKRIAGAAFVGLGVAAAPVALVCGIGAVPTTTNIPHLKKEASAAWAMKGYQVEGFDKEAPTSMGLLSMYDLKIGGGILGVNLRRAGNGAAAHGTMTYDTAGLINLHVDEPASP